MGATPEPPRPLSELAAPHWAVQLVRPQRTPVQWRLMARAAVALGVPLALGVATRRLDLGVLVSIGALCGTLVATTGPYRYRLSRMGFAAVLGAAGFTVGTFTSGHGWWTSAVMVALAALSAVISSIGANASAAGLQLLVFGILGGGLGPPDYAPLLFAAGAAWAVLLAIGAWPVRATVPERAAIALVYANLVDVLRTIGTRAAGPARQRLTSAMNDAHDILLSARSRLEGRDASYRRLFLILAKTTPVVEATVALLHARQRPPAKAIADVVEVGEAIRTSSRAPSVEQDGTALRRSLSRVVAVINDEDAAEAPPTTKTPVRQRFDAWLDSVRAGPQVWRHALRLALCIALAEVISRQLELDRSYWVALTVAIVLKPDFGSVFGRAVLRAGGTVIGVLLGAAVLAIAPGGWVLVALMAALAFVLPEAKARSYGLFSMFITPLVIVQLDLAHAGNPALVTARLVDTLAGCLIVLVFGYLLWPGSRATRLDARIAEVADGLAEYLRVALRPDPRGRSALRRRTYSNLSDLRVRAQQLISEPGAPGRAAAAWWPTIIGLERLTDAVTRVAVELTHGAEPPDPADVDTLASGVTEVAGAVREERRPRRPELPDDEPVTAIAEALTELTATVQR
ncbi:putative membrane protein YccC [Herbihabitans rhizosphaerae]|uniref:Putative membrane protein YccC n=1 Tax=Herbihabitans rhizosphaerae TaxID=1872711 RepID=A0A4Q7KVS5_9PSEU|nr:FUSC family protein [Herbihabitans rhizosphaerae]RZS40747.1 putative membrane protein YccC [Herbihabitans rhizosphaerae]